MKCVSHDTLIQHLTERYEKGDMAITVVYGPYSVGKTFVGISVADACHGVYLQGRKANEASHVRALTKALGWSPTSFTTLASIITEMAKDAIKEPKLLVIDDYPSLVEAVPQVPILLRDVYTEYEDTQLSLILIGNDVNQLKGRILGDTSLIAPFITEQCEVEPLTVDDVASLGWDYTDEEFRVLHRITNGMPSYIARFNKDLSLDDNIVNLLFMPYGALFHETERILQKDIRNVTAANSILAALAQLDQPLYGELNAASQVKNGTFSTRLSDLLAMRIVGRVDATHRGQILRHMDYHFENTFFEFWYRYVYPNLEAINGGKGARVYDELVKPHIFS